MTLTRRPNKHSIHLARYPLHVYYVPEDCAMPPCVLCGSIPVAGGRVVETNLGEPRVLCGICVGLACLGFEDLERTGAEHSALVSPC